MPRQAVSIGALKREPFQVFLNGNICPFFKKEQRLPDKYGSLLSRPSRPFVVALQLVVSASRHVAREVGPG